MMVRRVSADRERQPLPVHDPHDFHAFSALRRADLRATPLRRREHRVNETLRFVQAAPLAERIGHIHQDIPEHFVAAPRLEAAMHGLVVRITLRQHMPLGARVQNPQDRLQHPTGRNGFATRSPRNRSLLALGFERFFVAADQNQQIFDDNSSSRKNIESELAIAPEAVIELKRNYRNSGPVARLARAFHTGDPASPPPELPPPGGDSALLCSYAPARFSSICERIVKIVDRDPRKLIGVIAPNNTVRKRYLEGLRAVDPGRLDSGFPDIETFHTGHRPNVRFDEGGILVINAQACKGLEFDIAVLADIDQHYFRPENPDPTRKQFYVMVARARERVIMLREQGTNIRIDKILPDDSDVLRRTDILERSRN